MSRRNKVLNRMHQCNISYSQIAKHVMLPVEVVREWSYNRANIPYKYVLSIYDLLGLDIDDFFDVV